LCDRNYYMTPAGSCVACAANYFSYGGLSRSCNLGCPPGQQSLDNTTCQNCTRGMGCGCTGSTPYANGSGGCMECLTAATCPSGQSCLSGSCGCPPSAPYYQNGSCIQCRTSADCTGGQTCNGSNQCITPAVTYSCPDTNVKVKCAGTRVNSNAWYQPVYISGNMCVTDVMTPCVTGTLTCYNGNNSLQAYTLFNGMCQVPATAS
jgi:hypothetical protein